MLSILIPTYNYTIFDLVQELHTQAKKERIDFEIIVLDDGSETGIAEANKKISLLEHCRYIQNNKNLGRTVTRKLLAETAVHNLLLFLDADVLPVDDLLISRYIPYLKATDKQVVVGGYAYKQPVDRQNLGLRLKYGLHREQKSAADRAKNPYGYVFSGNFLTDKATFLQNNYPDNKNLYGLDNYFSYNLYVNKVSVLHIDNPIYHLGLEDDTVYFKKCIEAVKNRKMLLGDAPGTENINAMSKYYTLLKKYRLRGVVSLGFSISEPLLKKMILKKNPSLFCLDIYRLGYLCSLK